MKKVLFLTAFVCLMAFSAFAQKAADFSGSWALDVSKSNLGDRGPRIESMTMTVTQTDKDIKVETATKRLPPPDGMNQGGGQGSGGGMMRMRGGFGGDGTTTYTLDGKETSAEIEGQMGKTPVKLKATLDGGKLKLSRTSTFSGQMGEITVTTRETWTLSDDGKTLTVKRESESPRGTTSSELVFAKK